MEISQTSPKGHGFEKFKNYFLVRQRTEIHGPSGTDVNLAKPEDIAIISTLGSILGVSKNRLFKIHGSRSSLFFGALVGMLERYCCAILLLS